MSTLLDQKSRRIQSAVNHVGEGDALFFDYQSVSGYATGVD
jgi:hypothetical protein